MTDSMQRALDVLKHINANPHRKFVVFSKSYTILALWAMPLRFDRSILMPFVLPEKERLKIMSKLDELKPDILLMPASTLDGDWHISYDAEVLFLFEPTYIEYQQGYQRLSQGDGNEMAFQTGGR